MIKNADGWDVEDTVITKIGEEGDWYYLTAETGYTFGVSKEECGSLIPEQGDLLTVYTQGFSNVVGIVIDGVQVRYKTPSQVERERIDWLINYNQEKLDRLRTNWDAWQEKVENLHPTLRKRIRRFESQGGNNSKFDFWLEDGGYELAALEGANALLQAAEFYHPADKDRQHKFLVDWWSLNTKAHDYNYKYQMELVPAFGDGHSGNTAGAAYSLAVGILVGSYVEA